MKTTNDATVSVGDGLVVIRRASASKPVIANILGTTTNDDGDTTVIYLDRIVHKPLDRNLGEWEVTGAISSILYLEGNL